MRIFSTFGSNKFIVILYSPVSKFISFNNVFFPLLNLTKQRFDSLLNIISANASSTNKVSIFTVEINTLSSSNAEN